MKKKLLCLLSTIILSSSLAITFATDANNDLVSAIKYYKDGNFTECYQSLEKILKMDPSNAVAYYYLGMTQVQLGKSDDAITNYDKVISLAPAGSNLHNYALKGKRCIKTPEFCSASLFDNTEEDFIKNINGDNFSEEFRGRFEKLKIENLMREMNTNEDFDPQKLKDFRDYSKNKKSEAPTNDEIVNALRTLQNAGLTNAINPVGYSDLSLFTESSNNDIIHNMFGNSSMNPMLIQTLLSNNISQGF